MRVGAYLDKTGAPWVPSLSQFRTSQTGRMLSAFRSASRSPATEQRLSSGTVYLYIKQCILYEYPHH